MKYSTKRDLEETLGRLVASALFFFMGVGVVWLAAWVFDPGFSSGTVWFIALLFGWINDDLAKISLRQQGLW